ncbi:MAG: TIGR01777 family oxidoreductase [Gemmatimonadales bacterium]
MTGASGFIGSALIPALRAAGHEVIRLTRTPQAGAQARADAVVWDPAEGRLDPDALTGVTAVVHLAGTPVDERWTAARKRDIRSSRIDSTALLARTLAKMRPAPSVFLSASAIGYYGDRDDDTIDEAAPPGSGFLAQVAREWEDAAAPARDAGIRTVHPRFGVVLGRAGGALAKLLPVFEVGAGGKIGHGNQWMSWIARTDVVRALCFLLTADAVHGPANLTAPYPARNAEFAKVLGHVLHRPAVATVPAFALRLLYGELADEALLAGQRALPRVLDEAGFAFEYPHLEGAFRHELGRE